MLYAQYTNYDKFQYKPMVDSESELFIRIRNNEKTNNCMIDIKECSIHFIYNKVIAMFQKLKMIKKQRPDV